MLQSNDQAGIKALEQKSNSGDAESLYRIGITLIHSELFQNPSAPNFGNGLGNINTAADKGHTQSMYLMSLFYPLFSDEQDKQLAINYLKKSADEGNYAATYQMGIEYILGETVSKNQEEGIKYLQKSSEMGNAYAMFYLGKLLEPSNLSAAVQMYEKAAESRNNSAMYRLAELHLSGKIDGRPNYEKGKDWMNKAVNSGNKEALNWFENEAAGPNGNAEMNYYLIQTKYFKNIKVRDKSNAFDFSAELTWLQKMADNEDLESMYYMGQVYNEGTAVKGDLNAAINWFTKAADMGHGPSTFQLGLLYEYREELKDSGKALDYYKKAHELGSASGSYKIAEFFKYGKGGYSENDKEALKWYTTSANRGNISAMLELGIIYRCGRAIAKDLNTSNIWLRKAVEGGSDKAQKILSGEESDPCFDIRDIYKR